MSAMQPAADPQPAGGPGPSPNPRALVDEFAGGYRFENMSDPLVFF